MTGPGLGAQQARDRWFDYGPGEDLRVVVILRDLTRTNFDGIDAARHDMEVDPSIKVLILTTLETESHVIQALKAGASRYVLKDSSAGATDSSIVAVRTEEQAMASAVANRILQMFTHTPMPKEFYDGLTNREIEILKLLANGMAKKQIAFRLKISENTVRHHVSNIYEKLAISDLVHAVLYAVRKGLVAV